jgi:SAM-dependent methyltransferase
MSQNKWLEKWSTNQHIESKRKLFKVIDDYIDFIPKRILDIGCGLARESEFFQKKYNCELYLLDGDFLDTSKVQRDIKYGTVDNFKFYSKIDQLKESYDSRNMKYNFVDANNINISDDITFDLILSNVSCGFHYPANTYKHLVQKHSTKDTVTIFDLRNSVEHPNVQILDMIASYKKHIKASIKFV